MPSHQKPRRGTGGAWDDEDAAAWYGDDLIDDGSLVLGESGGRSGKGNSGAGGGGGEVRYYDEASGERGLVRSRSGGSSAPRPGGSGGATRLVSNNLHWGIEDITAERALQLSPAVLDFGIVQKGSLSRKRL